MRVTHRSARVLLSALRRRPREVVRLMGWSVVEVVPVFVSGRAIALAVDDGFRDGSPAVGFVWLGVLAVAVLAGAAATRQIYLRLAAVVEPFRDELVRHVVTGALHRATTGDETPGAAGVARLTRQVEVVRDSFAGMVMVVRSFVFTVASALLGLLFLTPDVLVFILPPFAVGLALFFGSLAALADRQRRLALADEDVAESAGSLTGGLRDIVANGGEDQMREVVGARVEAQASAVRALARLTTVRTLSLTIGGWLPVILVLVGSPWLRDRGATAGTILGALTYIAYAFQPALQMLVQALGGSGLQLIVNLNRILETGHDGAGGMSIASPVPAASGVPAASAGPAGTGSGGWSGRSGNGRVRPLVRRELELRDVVFGYGPHAEPVVDGLDLVVPESDHLVIVGPSGIGKSTVASLMAGLLQPQSGGVRLGGIPVAELDRGYRVVIPQEAYVFSGTLAENLVYLRPGASADLLDEAVDLVGLRPVVERLGGYHAVVGPLALSAGERQLIALTRSYLSTAPLAILDEATCHLDPAAEARAEQAFASRPGTLVVVAHRMSSALRARRILVMDGHGTALGSHTGLLVSSASYRDLVGHWELEPARVTGSNGVGQDGVEPVARR
ncbi:ATP-binding cassette domain-containing protein [Actinomadura sp. HBU206391]|uniref:ATP-binding cassette domain-containing protein n=1 Tax=Actinomadura sp. HBU206391 TaxID=2731692 RepID=UPI00164F966D|nr:ABC transporter ATP-binding protein [Actinomadura sp. HBU206391]MBC6458463.1 ABC transporter ATP-binding protein [Actinomadura sp. HBU206391]